MSTAQEQQYCIIDKYSLSTLNFIQHNHIITYSKLPNTSNSSAEYTHSPAAEQQHPKCRRNVKFVVRIFFSTQQRICINS